MRITPPSRRHERGVTILIVGITLLALVAMAALAIDVASLYEARSEAQRAADAAALAGAKMFVTSSYTSTPDNLIAFGDVCAAVNQQAAAAALVNPIAGQPASIKNFQCDNSHPRNPRVTVTVESSSLPTFFARIWDSRTNPIRATATAEAYNASEQSLPIEITNVKPWFIPNCDPGGPNGPCAGYFIDPTDGSLKNNGAFIGSTLHLMRQLSGAVGGDGSGDGMDGTLKFYGLKYPVDPALECPASTGPCNDPAINNSGVDTYIDNIACTSSLPMYCGQPIGGSASTPVTFEGTSPLTSEPTVVGTKCLIHAGGNDLGQGQDGFSASVPVVITGGTNNPNPSLKNQPNISRSDSVVTVPVFDGRSMNDTSPPAPIIGFLQIAVQETNGSGGLLQAVIVNAVGCTPGLPTPPTNPIWGGGSSPIPVRLVQTPSTP